MSRIPRKKALEIQAHKNYMELWISEFHRRKLSMFKQLSFQILKEIFMFISKYQNTQLCFNWDFYFLGTVSKYTVVSTVVNDRCNKAALSKVIQIC